MATAMKKRKRSKAGTVTAVVLTVFCLGLLGVGGWLFYGELSGDGSAEGVESIFQVEGLDASAKTGAPPGLVKHDPPPGTTEFGYRIETEPVFSQKGKGNIEIVNPQSNRYLLVLELCKKGDPALLYQSQYIAPNQYIEEITLEEPLEPGTHEAVAYLNLVDPKTMQVADIFEQPLVITVK